MDSFPTASPAVTSRRDFLKLSAQTLGLAGMSSLAARLGANPANPGEAGRILVLIHLAGGNDGLNTVVPLKDEAYHRLRPTLAIKPNQALPLDEDHGLHPACRGLHDLYFEQRLAVLHEVGAASLSHFGALETWSSGLPSPAPDATGWLGRFLDTTWLATGRHPAAIHFSNQLPWCLRGAGDHPIYGFHAPSLTDSRHVRVITRTIDAARPATGFPASLLGRNLQKVAALIAGGFHTRIYHLTLTGFDTHSHQAATHAHLLRTLSDGVAAFDRELRRCGASGRVLTLIYSEFGRSVKENERLGTDHAPAGPAFLVGDQTRIGLNNRQHLRSPGMVHAALLDNWLNHA